MYTHPVIGVNEDRSRMRGMTIIEVLVSVGVAVLIGLVMTNFFGDTISFNRIISAKLNATGEARRALKLMISEIRITSPSSLGGYALSETATSSFTFYTNVDTDALKERVRYFRQGDILRRGVIKPTGNPLTYVAGNETFTDLVHAIGNGTTSIFYYYGSVNSATSPSLVAPFDIASVRLVKIHLLINEGSTTSPQISTSTTQVSFRNLKDNL